LRDPQRIPREAGEEPAAQHFQRDPRRGAAQRPQRTLQTDQQRLERAGKWAWNPMFDAYYLLSVKQFKLSRVEPAHRVPVAARACTQS
jgi:hypothetical protein